MYPLPPHYYEEDEDRQAWWRVNACCIQDTPDNFVQSFAFFVSRYLAAEGANFYESFRESPVFHYQIIHDIAAIRFNAIAAPRHFCKSTLWRAVALFLALTRRGYRIGMIFPIQQKCRDAIGKIKRQLQFNPHILRDFGSSRPTRGDGEWSSDRIVMNNRFRSEITGMWMRGAMRGGRFDWGVADDCETDPVSDEVVPEYTAKLENLVLKVFVPMGTMPSRDLATREDIAGRGGGFVLSGTRIREDMYLARVLSAGPGEGYDFWNRWNIRSQSEMGKWFSWPDRTSEEEMSLITSLVGASVADSEFQNAPGESGAGHMSLHPTFHSYLVDEAADPTWYVNPGEARNLVRWAVRDPRDYSKAGALAVWRSLPASEWLGMMDRAIIVDTSKGKRKKGRPSDYSCVHVMGNDATYCWWSLDMVMGRWEPSQLSEQLFAMALRWRVNRIAIESVGAYSFIADLVINNVTEKLMAHLGSVPHLIRLKPDGPNSDKGTRIDRCTWRFELDRIRLPLYRARTWPYNEFVHEIEAFTPTLDGLRYDDAIDTMGYAPDIFRGKGVGRLGSGEDAWEGVPIVEQIARGRTHTEKGVPLVDLIPQFRDLTPQAEHVLEEMENRARDRDPRRRRLERPTRPLVLNTLNTRRY